MEPSKKLAITLLIFCGVILAAYFGYQALGRVYKPQNVLQPPKSEQMQSSSAQSPPEQNNQTTQRVAAPDFTMTDINGTLLTLNSLKGKPTVINFWATWCGFCVQEMPDFNAAYEIYGNQVNFVMLNVTDGVRETREKALAYYQEKGFAFPVYFDDQGMQGASAYQVSSFPTTYFIDGNGNLAAYAVGMLDAQSLQKGIDMAIAQDATPQDIKNTTWCTMDPVYTKIDAENAKKLMEEFSFEGTGDYVLLDVRTEAEFNEKRIPGAVLIPDYELTKRAEAELPDKTQVILVYCRSGNRSATAAKALVAMGYNHVYDFGGIIDWPYETTSGKMA